METSRKHLFVAGVPATGKTWLGSWLASNHRYVHIDAEKTSGTDFDAANAHAEWDELLQTGRADRFVEKLGALDRPVVLNWGFPPAFLYVVAALQDVGVQAWWIHGDRPVAREAFVRRGGIAVHYFDRQMDLIAQHWLLIARVFGGNIVNGLDAAGSQRHPQDIAGEMGLAPNSTLHRTPTAALPHSKIYTSPRAVGAGQRQAVGRRST